MIIIIIPIPDGLVPFQHQPSMHAVQQHMQASGEMLGLPMQERAQYYGSADQNGAAASQPAAMGLPMNYAQVMPGNSVPTVRSLLLCAVV